MAETWYRDGGTWRKAKELHYKDGGVWRKLKEAWYRDAGTWRKIFTGSAPVNPLPTIVLGDTTTATAIAALSTRNDGTLTVTGSDSVLGAANWFAPTETGIGSAYWARVTVTAGTGPTSGAGAGAWVSISGNPFWQWLRGTVGTTTATITLEIASDSAGTTVVASRSGITVSVTKEP